MILPLAALLAVAPAAVPAKPATPRPLGALTDRYAGAAAIVPAKRTTPTRMDVERAVAAEWPRYDVDHTGRLTPLEFSTWVLHANGADVAPAGVPMKQAHGIAPVSAMNATSRAFARADANHDNGITREELVDFLIHAAPARPPATAAAKAAPAPASRRDP